MAVVVAVPGGGECSDNLLVMGDRRMNMINHLFQYKTTMNEE